MSDPKEPQVPYHLVQQIAIRCYQAGLDEGRVGSPPPIVATDPLGTWIRLARLGVMAAEREQEQETEQAGPAWLKKLRPPHEE